MPEGDIAEEEVLLVVYRRAGRNRLSFRNAAATEAARLLQQANLKEVRNLALTIVRNIWVPPSIHSPPAGPGQ